MTRALEAKQPTAWDTEKVDLLAEKRRVEEAKEKERQMAMGLLLVQQEHNLEKAFLAKKELEHINREKEGILARKRAV